MKAAPPPFLVGIDLGTTNSAVAYVDRRRGNPEVEIFAIPQLVKPHEVAPFPLLPSFLYFGEPHEIEGGALALPWDARPGAIAGVLARDRGMLVPRRQVSSAKSWLAHGGVDRTAAILPWSLEPADRRISPVDATSQYLAHIRDAWNHAVASGRDDERFERQSIVLTVPASFDEEARELTVAAARMVGFEHVTLLEEPLAAFYSWLAGRQDNLAEELSGGEVALVCDVGGGTTDFSLVSIEIVEGRASFERIATGEHLLLGGDNLDLALSALAERKLVSKGAPKLALAEKYSLRLQASAAKERLLAPGGSREERITLPGRGQKLVGGTTTTEITREEVERVLIDGFLPIPDAGTLPAPPSRAAALRELGLPYENDPAITRHLLAFLRRSAALPGPARLALARAGGHEAIRPDVVLFNGGFFAPAMTRERVIASLAAWFGTSPRRLAGDIDPSIAVAAGAAHYGRLRGGIAPRGAYRVRAGSARAYYVALARKEGEGGIPAVALLARGTDEGTSVRMPHEFTVRTNTPVSFTLYSSQVLSDEPSTIVSLPEDGRVREHAPLVTILRYGRKSRQVDLPVTLAVNFTEVGTLELWCESKVSDHRWRMQFELRRRDVPGEEGDEGRGDGEGDAAVVPDEAVSAGEESIRALFAPASSGNDVPAPVAAAGEAALPDSLSPETLVAHLESIFGFGRTAWPASLIRRLADALIDVSAGRGVSARHEARWLNLFGFCLRPGYGAAKDPWRMGEARKLYAAGLSFPSDIQCRVEWTLLWQRVAGGLNASQQRELATRTMADLGLTGRKGGRVPPQVERESWRLLANLERLDAGMRVRIGEGLISRLRRNPRSASLAWAMGRLGARTPLYGPLSSVVPPDVAARWVREMVEMKALTPELASAIVQAASVTGDALRDVAEPVRRLALDRLREGGAGEEPMRRLEEPMPITAAETTRIFGEPLPEGLRLRTEDGVED